MPDLSDLLFTDAERASLRRHLGYPVFGSEASGNAGWRFFSQYSSFEYRCTNLVPVEQQEVRRQLAILDKLDAAILDAADNLDTDQAAVWHRNRSEVRDRERLLARRRADLAAFLGVPTGPGTSSTEGSCRVVV